MTDQTALTTTSPDSKLTFGQTALRPEDLVLPRVKITQQMSKEVADSKAKPGDFYNTLTGENYGPMLRVQPIQPFMQRIMLVRQERRAEINDLLEAANLDDLSEGDGLKCRSYDMFQGRGEPGIECNECPLSKWRAGNKPPLCTETYNVAAATEIGDLLILSMSKSGAKTGKRLFSALRLSQQAPWTRFFEFTTRAERNDRGNFFVPDFSIPAERPPSELIVQAVKWAEQFAGIGPIDVSPIDEEEEAVRGSFDPADPDYPASESDSPF